MTEDEKYVREHWVNCYDRQTGTVSITWINGSRATRVSLDSWSAAAEFTHTRLQQIRDVEEEIALIESYISGQQKVVDMPYEMPMSKQKFIDHIVIFKRILAARQAALADLKRGLRVAE